MAKLRTARLALTAAAAVALLLCAADPAPGTPAPVFGYQVLDVHPHDPGAFLQGLIYQDGVFYEGTGLWGESSLRKVEIETGAVLKRVDLAGEYFGEGITALRDTIYQITWQNYEGFTWVESGDSFDLVEAYPYAFEGWGLTHNGVNLIASDGSSTIRYLDPQTRQVVSQIQVRDDGTPVSLLNELEYVDGRIYANVWYSDRIAVIHAATGRVDAWLDLSGLRDSVEYYPSSDVMNGIAHDPAGNRLWVTGKRWPKLFQIEVPTLHWAGADEEPPAALPEIHISPNPSADRASVRFGLTAQAPVLIRLFNVEGRVVRTLPEEIRSPGNHVAEINVSDLPSGTYFLRLTSGPTTYTREVRVLR